MKLSTIVLFTLLTLSGHVAAKCTVSDFKGVWRVSMNFSALEDISGKYVAQRGGEIICLIRFTESGFVSPNNKSHCSQSGLNYPFGQIRTGSIQQESKEKGTINNSCNFNIKLNFDRNSPTEDNIQTVTLTNVMLDRIKVGFASEIDVAEPGNQVWHAGSAWAYKPAN